MAVVNNILIKRGQLLKLGSVLNATNYTKKTVTNLSGKLQMIQCDLRLIARVISFSCYALIRKLLNYLAILAALRTTSFYLINIVDPWK